jgi:hypothetical protein
MPTVVELALRPNQATADRWNVQLTIEFLREPGIVITGIVPPQVTDTVWAARPAACRACYMELPVPAAFDIPTPARRAPA